MRHPPAASPNPKATVIRNLKLRHKLIVIIAAPLAALVAFAVVGALQRRSTAQSSKADGRVIAVVQADGTLAQALEAEAAAAVDAVVEPGVAPAKGAPGTAALRQRTDQAAAHLKDALGGLATGQLQSATSSAVAAMNDRLAALSSLRTAVDAKQLPWAAITDTYGQAVSAVAGVARQMANEAHRPEVQTSLANLAALGQVTADVSENGNLLHGVLFEGAWPDQATKTRFLASADTEDVDLAVFKAGAPADAVAAYRNASSTAAVSTVDATRQEVRDGALKAAVAQRTRWAPAVAQKVARLHRIETGLGSDLAARNAGWVSSAERAAELFLLLAVAVALLALLVAGAVARSLTRRTRRLTDAAARLSDKELPRLVAALENPDEDELARLVANLEPIDVTGGDELGHLAGAFNQLQRVVAEVATEQAALLRSGIAETFVNLARRNQALLDRQIEFIDQLEMSETSPDQLGNLFKLDHLATRMRRNAESLLVLAGAEPVRRRGEPVPLASVVRAAIAEVEDFERIDVLSFDPVDVTRNASVDVTHLLAELMDNASAFSPPDTRVEVAGHRSSTGGYVLSLTDHGIGMSEDQLRAANELLADPPLVGLSLSHSLGFIVVGRLAARFDIAVRLFADGKGGLTAVVTLPAPVVVDHPDEPDASPELLRPASQAGDTDALVGAATGAAALNDRWDIQDLLASAQPVEVQAPLQVEAPAAALPQRAKEPVRAAAPGEETPSALPPPLPVADAGARLRFGELPARGTRGARLPLPAAEPAAPAAVADPEPAPAMPTRVTAAAPVARAPIRFGERPERLRGHRPEGATPGPRPAPARPKAPVAAVATAEDRRGVAAGVTAPSGGGGLARRVPGAAGVPQATTGEPHGHEGEPAIAPSKRSAEQVRSVLTNYRSGRDRGRSPNPRSDP